MTSKDIGGSRYVTAIYDIHQYVNDILDRGYVIEIFVYSLDIALPSYLALKIRLLQWKDVQEKKLKVK